MEAKPNIRQASPNELGISGYSNYPRLVRDRIPEIIEAMGNVAIWYKLDDERFVAALLQEMIRTSQRFADTESLETLSDLLEAVDAWLQVKGLTMEEVNYAREEKKKRCGSFERRKFLERVAPGEEIGNGNQQWVNREC